MKNHDIVFYKAPRYLFRKFNILQIVKGLDITTFVDIGCGAGELDCALVKKGYRGTGLDFSENALKVAYKLKKLRNISDNVLSFKYGDINTIANNKYDLVICCEVLEHIEDDNRFLDELHTIDARYLLLSVPAKQKWFDSFDRKVGHYRRYEKSDLKTQLTLHGYKIKVFRSYGYPFINLTRFVRKALSYKVKDQTAIKARTKESGINPIKMLNLFAKFNLEPIVFPLYIMSRLFETMNLSEGYLVLCKKKSS